MVKDVTTIVQRIVNRQGKLYASNKLFGDPAHNRRKKLTIDALLPPAAPSQSVDETQFRETAHNLTESSAASSASIAPPASVMPTAVNESSPRIPLFDPAAHGSPDDWNSTDLRWGKRTQNLFLRVADARADIQFFYVSWNYAMMSERFGDICSPSCSCRSRLPRKTG